MDSGPLDQLLTAVRAVGDPTRLRLLAVCAQGEWTVSELVQVLGQSQPRVSRHLKVLADCGLLDRFREGSWVFYRRAQGGEGARIARSLCRLLPDRDPLLTQDRRRLEAVREARREMAQHYFNLHAKGWEGERDLAVAEERVEAVLRDAFAEWRPASLLDIGTGTGRILRLLAGSIGFGLGIDSSHEMLAVARANLDRREARNCQVRHGDMYGLPLPDASFAAVVLHQVLHFADDPAAALAEAARVLAPGGRLLVVDLERHEAEWLRAGRAHRRLGFSGDEVSGWFRALGLDEEPPIRLRGPELTVVVWQARGKEAAERGPIIPGARSAA